MSNLKSELLRFEVHAVDHCNLACVGCNHASPFLKKREYQAEEYFPWIDMLVEGGAYFHTISISGGEPFLNKNINSFVRTLKERYGCHINFFTNAFWMKDEESIDKYAEALSNCSILMLSPYRPIVDKVGGIDRFFELGRKIRERFGIKVGSFHRGVITEFYQFDFYDEPRPTDEALQCAIKDCHQLTADGKLYRCTVAHSTVGHPTVTEGFRNSKDIVYDLKTDPQHRSLAAWKAKWPLDACSYCGSSCDRAYPTEWESDPHIRSMDREGYMTKLANSKQAFPIIDPNFDPLNNWL